MTEFAQSDDQAADRFNRYKSTDPFPQIPPALLNSADIFEYAAATGMIFPFQASQDKLKSASYEIDFLGEVYYWEDGGNERHFVVEDGTEFHLKKNSIAFVHLGTSFRLPDYIALRFNLKITHVHRGLLLGTGPLIDPGFVGRLLVPLHNLTSDDYVLIGGKGLIWVEFTKLSPNIRWDSTSNRSDAHYFGFPPSKFDLKVSSYFQSASEGNPIESSIPGEVREAREMAAAAKKGASEAAKSASTSERTIQRMRRQTQWAAVLTAIAIFVALISLTYQINQLIRESNAYVIEARKELIEAKQVLDAKVTDATIKALRERIEMLEKESIQTKKRRQSEASSNSVQGSNVEHSQRSEKQ